eukprot:CAMPEP_0174346336 /NCGR_PEP_ID=MMETSP0811_2-20130205/2022_1 /TAXON_ID=73025 ORGANISM="Eutreptiella gymnastica-like, Strain CCMP1594" /NCGR_SAMPLE_ID=MMETSP0811_2 /ASSEMBLY_ACC=CAM_ASM_000667 /LENGTH=61 /DNA_ID=CAMNT_0015470813 /DNA_START=191 /DNA_END=373 /DNA_ORIENTATION=-
MYDAPMLAKVMHDACHMQHTSSSFVCYFPMYVIMEWDPSPELSSNWITYQKNRHYSVHKDE